MIYRASLPDKILRQKLWILAIGRNSLSVIGFLLAVANIFRKEFSSTERAENGIFYNQCFATVRVCEV